MCFKMFFIKSWVLHRLRRVLFTELGMLVRFSAPASTGKILLLDTHNVKFALICPDQPAFVDRSFSFFFVLCREGYCRKCRPRVWMRLYQYCKVVVCLVSTRRVCRPVHGWRKVYHAYCNLWVCGTTAAVAAAVVCASWLKKSLSVVPCLLHNYRRSKILKY